MSAFHDPSQFARNWVKIAEESTSIVSEFINNQNSSTASGNMDPLNIGRAFTDYFTRSMSNPARVINSQLELWQDYLKLWESTNKKMMGESTQDIIKPDERDKRFKDVAWDECVIFDYIKQSYLLTARWLQEQVRTVDGLDDKTLKKVDFYTRQFVDAIAPSNFIFTNPEVIRATIDSNGENLVNGLKNMLEDLQAGGGKLKIKMTDLKAFELGKNIASTPGKVVFQNELMQLIQYEATTEKVHKKPLLMIPAWINKYYIFDLQEKTSFIKWMVDQGFTVFVISWGNPGEEQRDKGFDDYMQQGPLAALEAIEAATGEKSISVMAYCLGGTLTAATLAWLKAKKQQTKISNVSFLTTLVDFEDAGELSVFIDEQQLSYLENRMSAKGYLEGDQMATTFNMLRANDLIWSFVVNNYLLGKEPFPFDMLYWNSDSTRLPAKMHSFYLRNMYQKNLLVQPNALTIGGEKINLGSIDTPMYLLSTREDHIAPWKSTYRATQLYSGKMKFVLAGSGHVAGAINPPSKNKYSFWENDKLPVNADEWLNNAKETPGSWWPDWAKWNAGFSSEMVAARKPGTGKLKIIEEAPGSYVKMKS